MVLQVGTCGRVGHRRTFNTPVGSSDLAGVFCHARTESAAQLPLHAAGKCRPGWFDSGCREGFGPARWTVVAVVGGNRPVRLC